MKLKDLSPLRFRGESGQILILTALSLTALLGIAALSIDASFMYDKRNRLHAAADAAAKSAALEVLRNSGVTQASLVAFAKQQVVYHGFDPFTTTTVVVNHPPTSGAFVGSANYVEVLASEPTSTFFGAVLGWLSMTPGARAVAGASSGPNCIVILGGSLVLSNNVGLTMPGCSVADGGSLNMDNGATIQAQRVGVTVGACDSDAQNCTTGAALPSDPLSFLPAPTAPSHTCTGPTDITSNITLDVTADVNKYYCGMKIDNATVTFGPGVYYIAGPVTNKNGGSDPTLIGTGVTLYLAPGGSFFFDSNHVSMSLSAPTSGTYRAILFYQDRANTATAQLSKNNDLLSLSGAMYFPSATLTIKNNNDVGFTNDCSLIVAKTLNMNNNSALTNTCAGYGGSPIRTISIAE